MNRPDNIVARLEAVPLTRQHGLIAVLLATGTFFDSYDTLAIGSALTVIFATLHIDFVASGLLISLAYVGQLLGALSFGALSETRGRKVAFISSLVVLGIFSLGSALAWDFASLAAFRMLLGIGLGGEAPVAAAMMAEFIPGNHRGTAMLIFQSMYTLGALFTPLVGFLLISRIGPELGWRFLLGIGTLPLALALLARWFLPESVRWQIDKGQIEEAERTVSAFEAHARTAGLKLGEPVLAAHVDTKATNFLELLAPAYRRRTTLCWLHWFCTYVVTVGVATWTPGLFVRIGHLTPTQALVGTMGTNALAILMSVLAAWAIDRYGRRFVFCTSFAGVFGGACLGIVEIAALHLHGWIPIFVPTAIIQAFIIANSTGCYLYSAELYPTRMRSWGVSAGRAVSLIASIAVPTVIGVFLGSSLGAAGMFALFAASSLCGLLTIYKLGIETRHVVLEEVAQ
jgi:MFS transporter, putative metabolite:H+ symporter